MLFSRKKVPGEDAVSMRVCPIETVQPFAPLPAPLYLLLSGNDKFVSVKAPLDFFTPEELDRYKSVGAFFYPQFVKKVLPFRNEALQFRTLLAAVDQAKEHPAEELENTPSPYELSDAFLRMAGKLWSEGGVIEPFFVAVFAHEFCRPMDGSWMIIARETNVLAYDQAILRSGWATWQAMHLGYLNLSWLTKFRNSVFRVASGLVTERQEILKLLPEKWMRDEAQREVALNGQGLDRTSGVVEKAKLWSRAERLRTDLIIDRDTFRSIFGPGGFRDG